MDDAKQPADETPPADEDTPEYREWLAAAFDTDVYEQWLRPFEEMAVRVLEPPERGMVLEVGCATGRATERLLGVLPGKVRLVAQEDRGYLLDRARGRLADHVGSRLFFNSDALPKLRYDDKVFSAAFSNLTWWERPDRTDLLREVSRVLDDGGRLVLTAPLAGTFRQILDLAREVLVKLDLSASVGPALAALEAAFPTPEALLEEARTAGMDDVRVERAEVDRMFASSHGLFTSTVAQARWLGIWKRFLGDETQRLAWHVRRMIDAYWAGSPFPAAIVVGCLVARKPPSAPAHVAGRAVRTAAVAVTADAAGGFASGDAIADALLSSPAARPSVPPEPIRATAVQDDAEPIDVEPIDAEPAQDAWDSPSDLEHGAMTIDEGDVLPDDPAGDVNYPGPRASGPPQVEPVELAEPLGRRVRPVGLIDPKAPGRGAPTRGALPAADDDTPEWDRDWDDDDYGK